MKKRPYIPLYALVATACGLPDAAAEAHRFDLAQSAQECISTVDTVTFSAESARLSKKARVTIKDVAAATLNTNRHSVAVIGFVPPYSAKKQADRVNDRVIEVMSALAKQGISLANVDLIIEDPDSWQQKPHNVVIFVEKNCPARLSAPLQPAVAVPHGFADPYGKDKNKK